MDGKSPIGCLSLNRRRRKKSDMTTKEIIAVIILSILANRAIEEMEWLIFTLWEKAKRRK